MEENPAGLRVTMSQIAAAAGVSIPTVSKVINQRSDVAPATRKRVEQVISESGYVINRVARTLRQGRSGLIDFMIDSLDDEYTFKILQGVEEALVATDLRVVIASTVDAQHQELPWARRLADGSTDGTILVLADTTMNKVLELQRKHVLFVVVDRLGELGAEIPSVGATNWYGGKSATSYLLSLGHRRIGVLAGASEYAATQERLAGYRSALEEAGLRIVPELICYGDSGVPQAYANMQQLLALPHPPTAVFVGNDEQCFGVYRALAEHGLSIPHDMSVIGFDDMFYTRHMTPPLTTMHQPLQEMGRTAATMLLRLLEGEELDSRRVELATPLVKRQSCAPPHFL